MAKPLRGECEVELGGEKYTLRLGLGELEELDASTGLGTLALARAVTGPDAKISLARAVLAQAISDDGKKISSVKLGQLIVKAGFFDICTAAGKILTACLLDPSEGNAGAVEGK